MNTILFTGFEPFADWEVNPTDVAVEQLHGSSNGDVEVIGEVIPLRFHDIQETIIQLAKQHNPDIIVMSGQAGGDKIRLERIAQNKAKAQVPYNCGTKTNGELLSQSGPCILHSSLPLTKLHKALRKGNIPVQYSSSAGTFGCNQIFYYARHDMPSIPSGFIHVPLLPEQVKDDALSMEQSVITRGLSIILETLAINIIAS